MADISATAVKELREKTGAGMMDCKKALTEAGGDMEAAIDWLRKKGLSAAARKAGRVAAEGLVAVSASGNRGTAVEVNAETDFVGRNEQFQGFVRNVGEAAQDAGGDLERLKAAAYPGTGRTVQEELAHLIATIGENMNIRRARQITAGEGVVAAYTHNAVAPNLGKIGVLVALESKAGPEKLQDLGRKLAMHVAAARPEFLSIESVDTGALERERAVATEQARQSGKPEAVIPRIVEGRIRKYYEETVLLEQAFVMDPGSRVRQVLEKAGAELGAPVVLSGFVRFQLGEGIEKDNGDDFAAEVAKLAG